MTSTSPIQKLLGSTRGQVVSLVCTASRIIAPTEELGLPSNAVRGQLAILERDELVRRTVPRRGVGKPAQLYEPTSGGRGLLSRAALREAGHRLRLPHAILTDIAPVPVRERCEKGSTPGCRFAVTRTSNAR